ncbi:MAG: DUF58 domain-containing protein [Polyangiaceae bacterium]|nr:DUF58 domain-containing protein [Polyangiaceae bacterium]
MDINFARLNHILLPNTKAGRDRFRNGLLGKALSPLTWLYDALTDEGRVLLVGSTIVGLFAVDVQSTQVYILWSAIAGVLIASLLIRRFFRMPDAEVTVSIPRRVTVGDPLRFAVNVRNGTQRDVESVRVRGPFLPWDGVWEGRSPGIPHLPMGETRTVEVIARFSSRGEHHLDPFGACALVPLGIAVGKSVWSPGVKFLVVPKIANVARLSMPMGQRHQPGGVALASKTGESMDLLGVRPYRPGDPVKHLHARSSARAGVPVVREYQEEYFSRVGVVLDNGPAPEAAFEAAVSLTAGVVARLSRGEALIDLLVLGTKLYDLTIGRHLGFLEQALDLLAIAEMSKKPVSTEDLLAQLAPHLSRLSCVFVVTTEATSTLAEEIRRRGVACSTFIVRPEKNPPPANAPSTTVLSVASVEKGEALPL